MNWLSLCSALIYATCRWNFMYVTSDIIKRLSYTYTWSSVSYSISPPFYNVPCAWGAEGLWRCIHWYRALQLCIMVGCGFLYYQSSYIYICIYTCMCVVIYLYMHIYGLCFVLVTSANLNYYCIYMCIYAYILK